MPWHISQQIWQFCQQTLQNMFTIITYGEKNISNAVRSHVQETAHLQCWWLWAEADHPPPHILDHSHWKKYILPLSYKINFFIFSWFSLVLMCISKRENKFVYVRLYAQIYIVTSTIAKFLGKYSIINKYFTCN